MRKRVVAFCTCILLSGMFLLAQEVPDVLLNAFKKGNAGALDGYLENKVELIIQQRSMQLDKQAAKGKLTEFFAGNKVSNFQVNHTGKRNESGFIIGTLVTSNGSFRVNCFFRKAADKYVIHQIRIDKSNE